MEAVHLMHCEACRAGAPTVTREEMNRYRAQAPDWQVTEREGIMRLECSA